MLVYYERLNMLILQVGTIGSMSFIREQTGLWRSIIEYLYGNGK